MDAFTRGVICAIAPRTPNTIPPCPVFLLLLTTKSESADQGHRPSPSVTSERSNLASLCCPSATFTATARQMAPNFLSRERTPASLVYLSLKKVFYFWLKIICKNRSNMINIYTKETVYKVHYIFLNINFITLKIHYFLNIQIYFQLQLFPLYRLTWTNTLY